MVRQRTVNPPRVLMAGSIPAQPTKRTKWNAGVAQLVEHQPSKLRVAGSSLVSRSRVINRKIGIAGIIGN
jgi:hypothetical protein